MPITSAFDRTIVYPRERPLSSDIDSLQAQVDRSLRDTFKAMLAGRAGTVFDTSSFISGFLGDSFKVRASAVPDMTVTVSAGLGFYQKAADVPAAIGGVIGLDDLSSYKPLPLVSPFVFNVPTAPGAGQERWDIIEVAVTRRADNPLVRETFDPVTSTFVAGALNKSLRFSLDEESGYAITPGASTAGLSYVQGVSAALGVPPGSGATVPATTAGYQKVCEIYVGPTVVAIPANVINDTRKMVGIGGAVRIALKWTQNTGTAVPTGLTIDGAPGVLATIQATGPANGYIALIAGGMSGAHIALSASGGAGWVSVYGGVAAPLVVNLATQTNFASGLVVSDPIDVGIGQSFLWAPYYLYNASGGTSGTVQANTAAAVVTAQISIRY